MRARAEQRESEWTRPITVRARHGTRKNSDRPTLVPIGILTNSAASQAPTMHASRVFAAALAGVALLWSAGCGGNTGAPPTIPVKGTIKVKGQPLTGDAEVCFVPKGGGDRRPGIGTIQSGGTYVLTSYGVVGDGVEPGEYTVIVRPIPPETKDGGKKDAPPPSTIPEIYHLPSTSTLTATVGKGDKGKSFDFDLK